MAGILDFLEQGDNPLGLALLAAGGPTSDPNRSGFGQRIAGAVSSAQAQRAAAAEREMMRQFRQSQIAENASQAALREAQIAEAKRKADIFGGFAARLSGGGAGMGAAPAGGSAGGAPDAPAGAVSRGAGGGLASMTPDDLALAQLAGLPNLTDHYKLTQPDMVDVGGGFYVDRRKIQPGVQPGAQAAVGAAERQKAEIGDQFRRVEVIGPDGRKYSVRAGDMQSGFGGGAAPPVAPAGPGGAPPAGPRPLIGPTNAAERGMAGAVADTLDGNIAQTVAGLERDLATPGAITDPRDRQNAEQYLALMRARQAAATAPGGVPAAPVPTPAPPLIGAGAGRGMVNPPAAPAGVPGGLATDFSPQEKLEADVERERRMLAARAAADEAAAPGKDKREIDKFRQQKNIEAGLKNKGDYDKQISQADEALKVVDKALKHPGLSAGTGLQSKVDPRNYIPGTDAYNFSIVNKQLQGKAFLAAFESLKGGGAISEAEGNKAQAAIARLEQAQSTPEYKAALEDFADILKRGRAKAAQLKAQAGQDAGGGGGRTFQSLPPASQYTGKTARDTVTGKRFRSDGLDWKPE
jgi:hypothetical protein